MITKDDPLLILLLKLCEMYHYPVSAESLVAGLPLVDNKLTPQLFIRAAEHAGFLSKLKEQPLKKISPLVLPVLLLLKNSDACLLINITTDTATIISSELPKSSKTIPLNQLEALYTGYVIYIQPVSSVTKTSARQVHKKSWFWGTLWEYRRTYYEILLGAFLINLFTLASPLFVMNIYDRVVPNNAMVTLWVLTTGMLVLLLFDLTLRFLRTYLIDISGKKADVVIASHLFSEVLNIQLIKKPKSTGELVNTLREFEFVRDFITSSTLTTVIDLPFIIIFIILIAYISFPLVIIPLIGIPLLAVIAWMIEKPLRENTTLANQVTAKKNSVLFENLAGLEIIKSLNAQGVVQSKWEKIVAISASLNLRARLLSSSIVNIAYYIQQLVTIMTVVVGVYEIEKGNLSLGGLIACSILASRAIAPIGQFANVITRYQQARTGLRDLNELMCLSSERENAQQFLSQPHFHGDLEFKDVTFNYPGQSTPAIHNISFKIKAREKIAILGNVGSGKSTLQKLILKLYLTQSGAIYFNGIDINQLDPTEIRKNIGYVPQDVLLFSGSLRENIALSMPWADDQSIIRAAEISGAIRFISKHPQGINLYVGERGEGLSGGQRQLISITRALIGDPPIILFDEPTSAMDDTYERQFIAQIHNYIVNKTLILVTHRYSMLTLVNRIIVMDNGKIIADGPKEEILSKLKPSQPKA